MQDFNITASDEFTEIIEQKLCSILENNSEIQRLIVKISQKKFADKYETESRFDQILEELRQDRAENRRLWDESKKQWDENSKRWEEADKKFYEMLAEMRALDKKFDKKFESTIGALGSRWGIASESSFRDALKDILESRFDVETLNITEYDEEGIVFGHPDQIEFDIVIKNGQLIICEIKSSMSKSDMYAFHRKVRFYEQKHNRKPDVMMVISPMTDAKAKTVAEKLGIKLYSYADDVKI
jgi:hypothetical protein